MTGAFDIWLSKLIAANSAAAGPILLLAVCAVVVGLGWAYRDRITRWWSTSLRVAGLLTALVVVTLQVSWDGWLVDVDNVVTAALVGHRTPFADQVAVSVTEAFGPPETACAAVLVAVVAVVKFRSFLSGLTILLTVGGASASCTAMKLLLARSRPPIRIQETLETDYSFPSGHVTGTVALVGILVVVAGMHKSAAIRGGLACAAVVIVAAVAMSRLYLGVHWLTDVLAGMLLGTVAVEIGAAMLHRLADHDETATPDGRGQGHKVNSQRRWTTAKAPDSALLQVRLLLPQPTLRTTD